MPALPGAKAMLHWSFPDPAAAGGTEEARLAAFRQVRDGLRSEIGRLVGSSELVRLADE